MLTKWNKVELPEKAMKTFGRTLQSSRVVATPRNFATTYSLNQHASDTEQIPYWKRLSPWKDVPADDFLKYGWQVCSVYRPPLVYTTDHRY